MEMYEREIIGQDQIWKPLTKEWWLNWEHICLLKEKRQQRKGTELKMSLC